MPRAHPLQSDLLVCGNEERKKMMTIMDDRIEAKFSLTIASLRDEWC